ncbi:MAG: peptidoglycan-binding protein [Candidatus Omnitrophica bacterium]|nr:peptidoglycan-binding protein [Candidatus Omnitrophota bacterium]MBU1996489.1 peptidoglycan-binding protein [Candidatus Omnitrophota bacterium]MBU4334682.1 peptidoglycan-binding protein [Candidatus Omnitrophota bacterium]
MVRGALRILVIGVLLFIFVLPVRHFIKKAVFNKQLLRQEKEVIGSVDMTNPRVKDIQKTLQELHHYAGSIEGKMNEKTRLAIRKFQDDRGLTITGIVDSKTLSALNIKESSIQKTKKEKTVSQLSKESKQLSKASKKSINKDDLLDKTKIQDKIVNSRVNSKERVQEIQLALKKLGYYKNNVDGKLGIQTKRAVKEFQLSKNLKADGVVGPKTWDELKRNLLNKQ